MTDRQMWCDGFDMDLSKVIPEARDIVGNLGEVELFTTGHTTDGTLNHPTVWNSEAGMASFFGFSSPARPVCYVTHDPIVRCTFWEAIRDCWSHSFLLQVELKGVWNPSWADFEKIMWSIRGWGNPDEAGHAAAVARAQASLLSAVERFSAVCEEHRVAA